MHCMITLLYLLSFASAQEIPTDPAVFLPDTPKSFSTAKKRMYEKIYFDHEVTIYCGCDYNEKVVNLSSCGMEDVTVARAQRTEAEHLVPAWEFGRTRACWADGGRANCLKIDDTFRAFHNDLHNLAPAVGEINGRRSNLAFGYIDGED